ncbi:MAG: asparaginase [Geminicoccaceae bacterium]|nr:asparaginase [Geminicoccaceae bacterium]
MSQADAPVAVEVMRGGMVESGHRVRAAVVDDHDRLLAWAGDVEGAVYPRSAIKMFQAIPLVETGAADAFGVTNEELALACASHGGEPMHVDRVTAWLARLGLAPCDLGCGAHAPSHGPTAREMLRHGFEPNRAHNNCSGKHTGMLTAATHKGEPVASYLDLDHPVQQRVLDVVRRYTGDAVSRAPGVDGCGVPTWAIPLRAVALAAARFGASGDRAPMALRRAMGGHPELVAGTGRCCTAVMRTAPHVVVKTGAEGVFLAAIPDLRLGIALKVEDGARRASEVALIDILRQLDILDEAAINILGETARPVLRNFTGREVGSIRAAGHWLERA